jgi:predicted dehydrogenase
MPSDLLNLAFIGGAPNSAAGYAHYVASRMDGLWNLTAGVFSTQEQVNKQAADIYGVPYAKTYSSLADLLKEENGHLDAVAILTPTPFHFDMTLECLRAGMPVICEKSLSLNSDEANEIQLVCDEMNGFLAIMYNYSGYPIVREMRQLIRDGILGDVIHFQVEMPQEGFIRTDELGNTPIPQDWRLKDNQIPTIHLDLAVHLHQLLHYLTGLTPLEVMADQISSGAFDVVDNVIALCRYTNNVHGQVWFSKSSLGYRNGMRIRIFGSKASVDWMQVNPEEILISYKNGRREIFDRASNATIASASRYTRFKAGHPAGFNEAMANVYVDIHTALLEYKKHGCYVSDEIFDAKLAYQGMLWLEAMTRSCVSGTWEKVVDA